MSKYFNDRPKFFSFFIVKCFNFPTPTLGAKTTQQKEGGKEEESLICNICSLAVAEAEQVRCLYPTCGAVSHILCLAQAFTKDPTQLLPVLGDCPTCGREELWGNIIRKRRGCYQNLQEEVEDLSDD